MADQITIPVTPHEGIAEHFLRIGMFFNAAAQQAEQATGFRILLAAIYSCRAIVELMFEAADRKEISINRHELSSMLATRLPYYGLVERIRIHDFHRFGLRPPSPEFHSWSGLGPITLKASGGAAAMVITPQGPRFLTTGKSKVIKRRPLFSLDGHFYDEDTDQHVSLQTIVKEFARGIAEAVDEFEALRIAPTASATEEPTEE